jgi:hypothetical protein
MRITRFNRCRSRVAGIVEHLNRRARIESEHIAKMMGLRNVE